MADKGIDIRRINPLVLAYIGDSIYENAVRDHIIRLTPYQKLEMLHKRAVKYVKASSQYLVVNNLIEKRLFTDEEIDIIKRGRNTSQSPTKNAEQKHYFMATGFEAILGYLYLKDERQRLDEILNRSIEIIDEKIKESNKKRKL